MNSYLKTVRMQPDDYREFAEVVKLRKPQAGEGFGRWLDRCFSRFEVDRQAEQRPVAYSETPLLDPELEADYLGQFEDWNHLSEVAVELGVI